MSSARALALIDRADATWEVDSQAEILDEAIRLAREADDEDAEYAARMRAVPNAAMRFVIGEAVTHLAWCVGRHDKDARRFPRRLTGSEDLLYLEDWCLRQLALSDALSPETVAELIDGHARRLGPGAGEHSLAVLRALHSWATGDLDGAAAHIGRALDLPGDAMTHCTRCSRDVAAQIFEAAGDAAGVVVTADDFVADPCGDLDQPASAMSRGLFAWRAAGRVDDADRAYARAAREVAARATTSEVLGRLARYALISGRDEGALGHVEDALPWIVGTPLSTHLRLGALREAAAVLAGLESRGAGERTLTSAHDPRLRPLLPARAEGWTIASAAPVVSAAARDLAARFDARGGTTFHVEQLERTMRDVLVGE